MTSATTICTPEASKEQGEIAMKYLDLCHTIEVGGHGEAKQPRELTTKEAEVKDAALCCLMVFFVQNPPAPPAKPA